MDKAGTLKTLQVIYKALLMGQVLFMGIVIFMQTKGALNASRVDEDTSRILQVMAVAIGFGCLWGGIHFYRKRIAVIKDSDVSIAEKLKQYQAASIIKWGLTEGPSLFCIVGYFLTGNWSFLALAGIIIFVFAGYNPQKALVMRELGLGEDELI
jgi:hypothetical protein